MQTSEKEENAENEGTKPKAAPVFFVSLVGTDKYGKVDEFEHIFDFYS
jgi:hypothetical protein